MERILAASRRESRFHGLLIVDKPGEAAGSLEKAGRAPTSHDVVQKVRRWSGQRRVGHTGTLDPTASGVLVLCLGYATRLAEYYQNHDKQYYAEIILGTATDSYDAAGTVVAEAPAPLLDRGHLEEVLMRFRGEILQTPPVFSAIKLQGEALYHKARRGDAVQVEPRRVAMRRLDVVDYEPGRRICLRVVCSAGAYIRSLAHDIGLALGSYAYLDVLRREAAGPFRLDEAHRLEAVESAAQAGRLAALLRPPGYGLDLIELRPDAAEIVKLGQGQAVALALPSTAEKAGCPIDELAQVITPEGELAGIVRCLGTAHPMDAACVWRAEKWMSSQ